MLIRTFQERDVGGACRITNHFIEHTPVHFGTTAMSEAEFAGVWREGCGRYPWLAAEVIEAGDTALAGYAKAGVWRAREAYARTAEVSVYLDPERTGRGLGRALYAELLTRLRAAGFHTAVAGAVLPNEASGALHESMGFAYVGKFKEVGRKFGSWHDVGWWQVMLNEA